LYQAGFVVEGLVETVRQGMILTSLFFTLPFVAREVLPVLASTG